MSDIDLDKALEESWKEIKDRDEDEEVEEVVEGDEGKDLEEAPKDDSDESDEGVEDPTKGKVKNDSAGKDDPAGKDVEDPTKTATDPNATAVNDFPKSWGKNDALAKDWANIPPSVKAQIHKREQDFLKGYNEVRQRHDAYEGIVKAFQTELQPYEAHLRANRMTGIDVLKAALPSMHRLKYGSPAEKASEVIEIARTYGVDLKQVIDVNEKMASGHPIVDPYVKQLESKLNDLTSRYSQEQQRARQQEINQLKTTFEAFRADPKNEFIEEVWEQMINILNSSKQELSLQEVYNQACYAVPSVREKLVARQVEERRKQAVEKAAAAKSTAKTNVKKTGRHPASSEVSGSLDDILNETYAEIKKKRR